MRYWKLFVVLAILMVGTLLVLWQSAFAGPPQKPGNPGLPGCLSEIAAKDAEIANLNDLVNQLRSQALVPKTGQTDSYTTGDDGALKKGVPWPDPRFSDNGDGIVTDNLTGLVWLKDASCTSFFSGDKKGLNYRNWSMAITAANFLVSGDCGLSDGSVAGDWRLPNVRELESLVDYGRDNPSFPEIHPFAGLVAGRYWSPTSTGTPEALLVNFYFGYADHAYKDVEFYVWPVRDARK